MLLRNQLVFLAARFGKPLAFLLVCFVATVLGCKSEPPTQNDVPPKVVENPITGEERVRTEDEHVLVTELQKAGGAVMQIDGGACVTLSANQVTEEDFEKVVYLNEHQKVTVLYAASITDRAMASLAKMPDLERIQIDSPTITDAGFAHLAGLKKVTSLSFAGSPLTDAALEHLAGLTNLEDLYLPDTKITGPGLRYLIGLTKLKEIALDNSPVTDAGMEYLAQLPNLEVLGLSGTQVTDAGIKYFEGNTTLKSVGFQDTRVTPTGVQLLKSANSQLRVYN